ncbi:unnamed protein product [Phytophthora lilii]|uniref:Unnamed protein product n=1 Tax=Phytophthora lilii TaxID=2077276 RepID=A0A9W6Y136_9STRA|nr:unnamed protein product [Phytophthora lilii]
MTKVDNEFEVGQTVVYNTTVDVTGSRHVVVRSTGFACDRGTCCDSFWTQVNTPNDLEKQAWQSQHQASALSTCRRAAQNLGRLGSAHELDRKGVSRGTSWRRPGPCVGFHACAHFGESEG